MREIAARRRASVPQGGASGAVAPEPLTRVIMGMRTMEQLTGNPGAVNLALEAVSAMAPDQEFLRHSC